MTGVALEMQELSCRHSDPQHPMNLGIDHPLVARSCRSSARHRQCARPRHQRVHEALAPVHRNDVAVLITTIEAALGLRADYQASFRFAPDRHKSMRATNRMRGRVAGLLGVRRYSDQYETLFNVRSTFLHGRTMAAISTDERLLARSLARQVVEALILATQAGPIASREDFLDGLLDRGLP